MENFKKVVNFDYEGVSLKLAFDSSESAISTEIERTSCWEPWQLKLYSLLLKNESATFVDIGANVGVNSIFAKRRCPKTRVIAVEPAPINLQLLRENISHSSIEIEVIPVAVSDHDGDLVLVGDQTNAHIGLEGATGIKVESMQLDNLIRVLKIDSIELIKIDVEGYTDLVLSYSDKTLGLVENAIVEVSLSDLELRYSGNQNEIKINLVEVYEKLSNHLPNVFYISRTEGLVSVDLDEFVEVLLVEQTVGDFLFSKFKHDSISVQVFSLRKIRVLQHENHLRILENIELTTKVRRRFF
jgi:FkbM family methyltransferase